MTMVRAAVTEKPGRIALHEFPMPDPEPGAVVMKVHYSGICGTDKHTFRGESKQYAGTPHERDLTYPLICGHENVGEVVAIGGEVLRQRGPAAQGRRPHRARRQCRLRRLPFLPQRLSLLHVREPAGLRQQPALRPRAASLRRLGGAHVPAARDAALPGAGRPAGPCRGADGDHVGDPWRGDGAEPARPHRRQPLRPDRSPCSASARWASAT